MLGEGGDIGDTLKFRTKKGGGLQNSKNILL